MKCWILSIIAAHLLVFQKIQGSYVIEVALRRWHNPFKIEHDNRCCDSGSFFPTCSGDQICETRFDICLQLFSFSLSNRNCPYGKYFTRSDESWSDPDNITFALGIDIEGSVPNPMTFNVPESRDSPLRLVVMAFEEDQSQVYDDDLINIMRFTILPNSSSSQMIVRASGQFDIGTVLEISYRTYCAEGFTGSDCMQLVMSEEETPTATSTALSDSNLAVRTIDYSVLSILGVIFAMCLISLLLLVFISCYLLCKKPYHKAETTEVNDITDQPHHITRTLPSPSPIPPSSNITALFNSYKGTPIPSIINHSTLDSSISSSPPRHQDSDIGEDNYAYTSTSLKVDPDAMYMNPAYVVN